MFSFHNKVFKCDVMSVLRAMPDDSVDMIFGDPDYNIGIKYDGVSYTTTWDEYIEWYGWLAEECMRVLHPTGNLFFVNFPKQNAYLRVKYLDNIAYDVKDYVWVYSSHKGTSPRKFTTAHRSILHATKLKNNRFYKEQVEQPYKNLNDKRIQQRIRDGHKGRMPYSWLEFNQVKNVSKEKTEHPCQIPMALSRLLIEATTQPGDLVFALFGGSGSEVVVADELGRKFVCCEIVDAYVGIIERRLKEQDAEFSVEVSLRNPKLT